ncbi:MAG: dTDP-4-dehydrorhamnose reductase [Chitinophagaceae bacterium]|nr:dTDP-4-dehydrorhamnose reductase [Chitinophagaceae bacterium]
MQEGLIVVTGGAGQLGQELQRACRDVSFSDRLLFTDREQLDLSKPELLENFFVTHRPAYFIHGGAYTAVDKAEQEKDLAFLINATATGEIARLCNEYHTRLIYVSTDYVFNGQGTSPYGVDEATVPVNHYGYTKWMGEELIRKSNAFAVIIRTSWVFSSYGHNFVKTMLRLMSERSEIKVVNDQRGCPTYAADLAAAILQIIQEWKTGNTHSGTYHFSNEGDITWYEFACAIRALAGLVCDIHPIPSSDFPTPAKRPSYSVLDTTKISADFGVEPRNWKEALQACWQQMQ